jgi:hypothetical protein
MIWDEAPEPRTPAPGRRPGEAANGNAGAASGQGDGSAVASPSGSQTPAPRRGGMRRTSAARPSLTGEQLETQIIENSMEEAAEPDLSTVGPAPPRVPSGERE